MAGQVPDARADLKPADGVRCTARHETTAAATIGSAIGRSLGFKPFRPEGSPKPLGPGGEHGKTAPPAESTVVPRAFRSLLFYGSKRFRRVDGWL